MTSDSNGFIHKVFFMSNRSFAELCASRIRSGHPDVRLSIHSDFDLYLSIVYENTVEADLILINYFFIDEVVMALPDLDRMQNLHIHFIVNECIDGVAFDLAPCTSNRESDPCDSIQPCQIVSSRQYKGVQISRNKSRFRQELISKIQTLNILKSFVPKIRNYFTLDEFLDSCFHKLLGALRATGGILIIQEKKNGRTIFHKIYGEGFKDRVPVVRLRTPVCRKGIVFKDIPEAHDPQAHVPESGAATVQICASIESAHARGYFKINTDSPVTAADKTLVKVFKEQAGLFIDNTLTTQEMLERLKLNISLIEPEIGTRMAIDESGKFQGFELTSATPAELNKRDGLGVACGNLWRACDYFGTSACQSSGCLIERAMRDHRGISGRETETTDKDGAKRPDKSNRMPDPDAKGQIPRGRALIREIARRINLENKFSRIEQLARLAEFASEFAHEIRNPVTGISSNAQFLYETADMADEYKAVIEEILLGSEMLERTVRKYLNLAKPQDPRLEKCSLNNMLEYVFSQMHARIVAQNLMVEFNLGEGLPEIYIDPGQVRQVYMNLVMNAIEAMPNGGRLVIQTFLRMEGDGSELPQPKSVVSSIADSGTGINPEDMERVFDPFYTTKHSSTGLGLYTSFNILKRHNADIYLLSEAGKGTTVTVSFPLPNGS